MIFLLFFFSCQQDIPPPKTPSLKDPSREWKSLLLQATEESGLNYGLIKENRQVLDRYVSWIGTVGPQMNRRNRKRWNRSKRSDRHLTFFANAYNAWVIYSVLDHWPITSVQDVDIGVYRRPNVGFFFGQRFKVDGEYMSLYHLEHERLLGNFHEPLIHVMLNCASNGCPPIQYWEYKNLTSNAEKAMTAYVNGPKGARQTENGWEFTELFSWYQDHFVEWSDATDLCQYLLKYSEGELTQWLEEQAECTLSFFPYDWSLNSMSIDTGQQ